MNTFIMCVGLPSSGKSTWSNSQTGYIVHSSDALRKELYGDENYQDKNGELFQELHKRIRNDLGKGKNVILDATNISYKRRMEFLRQINYIKCNRVCYLFATPYEDCVKRDSDRERSVGEEVIKRMYKNFYIPQKYEGWDDINIIWNYDEHDFDSIKYFWELDEIKQDNPHHTLSIGNHCDKCARMLLKISNTDVTNKNYILECAAQFHDIGKKFTKEFNEKKGYCTYYQHHLTGAYDSLFYLDEIGWRDDDILKITNYIQWHMQPFFIKEDKTKYKFIKLVGEEFYNNLMLLHEADKLAK